MITVHQTWKGDRNFQRKHVLHVLEDCCVSQLSGANILIWLDSIAGQTVRTTWNHPTDWLFGEFEKRDVRGYSTHFHRAGIPAGLSIEDLLHAFAAVPESLLRLVQFRADLAELRFLLAVLDAVQKNRIRALTQVQQIARDQGFASTKSYPPDLREALAAAGNLLGQDEEAKPTNYEAALIRRIAKLAATIRECVLFNTIAEIRTSWLTAAHLVAASGGPQRFDSPAAFWKNLDHHVIDGHYPRREAGKPSHNQKLAMVCWRWSRSLMNPHASPYWKEYLARVEAFELAVHDRKKQEHPHNCFPPTHCRNMALRKTRKELLKRFYLACKGERYQEVHDGQQAAAD